MSTPRILIVLVLVVASASPVFGTSGDHVLRADELHALLAEEGRPSESIRSSLDDLLGGPVADRVAVEHDVDLERVRDAVATLDEVDLRAIEPSLRQAEEALAGGDRLVISASTLIIILLILLIIAAD